MKDERNKAYNKTVSDIRENRVIQFSLTEIN